MLFPNNVFLVIYIYMWLLKKKEISKSNKLFWKLLHTQTVHKTSFFSFLKNVISIFSRFSGVIYIFSVIFGGEGAFSHHFLKISIFYKGRGAHLIRKSELKRLYSKHSAIFITNILNTIWIKNRYFEKRLNTIIINLSLNTIY